MWKRPLNGLICFPNFKPQGAVLIQAAMHDAKHNIKVNKLREYLYGNYLLGKD